MNFFGYNTEFNFDRYDLGGDDECCFACRHCDGWLIACTGTCGTKLGGWGTCWRFDGGYVGR